MKRSPSLYIYTCIFFLILFSSCQSSVKKEKRSQIDTSSVSKNTTIQDVEQGIRANIDAQIKAGDGYFTFWNDSIELSLKLVRVHTEYLSVLGSNEFFACVDLATENGDVYDVDFFLEGSVGDMKVTQTDVHKLNGKPSGVIGFYYFGDSFYDQQDMIYPELIKKVMPKWFTGLFAAVVMGAVLSTFNSVLNSAATIFSVDVYKRHINPSSSDRKMVKVGKSVSAILALFAIISAPMVANASDGLYQLLQQLNGIFFIPVASIMLAGFFLPKISAMGAKAALFSGLSFYIICIFILEVDLHFIHIWGIEFLLNMAIMFGVSYFYPNQKSLDIGDINLLDLTEWKHTKKLSIGLCVVTLLIYIVLGQV